MRLELEPMVALIRRLIFFERSIKDVYSESINRTDRRSSSPVPSDLVRHELSCLYPPPPPQTLNIKGLNSLSNYFRRPERTKATISPGSGQRQYKSAF